jgi:hypothetical protein
VPGGAKLALQRRHAVRQWQLSVRRPKLQLQAVRETLNGNTGALGLGSHRGLTLRLP